MTDLEREFIVDLLTFVDAAAGEGIGIEIGGKTIWADDMVYKFFRELQLQRQEPPTWIPHKFNEEWLA